jgi:2-keto-4-pentenoate hydratase
MAEAGDRPRVVARTFSCLARALFFWLIGNTPALAQPEDWADVLREDRAAARPWPALSAFEPALSDPRYAYAVQRGLVGRNVRVVAWRSLFSSPPVAAQFRVRGSAYTRLPSPTQLLHPPYVFRHAAWQRPHAELGLAARLNSLPTRYPVTGEELGQLVMGWSAMVVVADMGFDAGLPATLNDLIAVNGGAEVFMTGPLLRVPDADPASCRVNLSLDGRQLAWGRGDELPGGPLNTLAQLLNRLADSREAMSAEQIFFTGALGRATPLDSGRYSADFGSFGRIDFESRRVVTRPGRP